MARVGILLALVLLASGASHSSFGQAATTHGWDGEWVAEGTLFRIAVKVQDQSLLLTQVESLGFVWESEAGEVSGTMARIPVRYAGVSGIIQAELVDADTAIAFAASCLPEFMVVCALAENRQAVFRRVESE